MALPTAARLDQLRQVADPPADEVLQRLVAEQGDGEARRLFDQLIRDLDLPATSLFPAAADFLEATRELPEWADFAQIDRAHALFMDHGPKFLLVLYFKSLPLLYLDARGARVLVQTSRLTNEDRSLRIFARRIAETGQFLLDVMAPGSLAPGGRGVQAIQKVRLIHAAIRRFIPEGAWDATEWGRPINQEDLALTLMSFSVVLTDALNQWGIVESDTNRSAFLHTWKAIGFNLGVQPELLPEDQTEGLALLDKILDRQAAASEGGQLLTRSLLEFSREHFSREALRTTPESLVRFLIGAERARLLGISADIGCFAWLIPEAIRAYFSWGERLEDKAEGPLRDLIDHLSVRMARAMVNYFNVYKGRPFSIPEQMKRAWFENE